MSNSFKNIVITPNKNLSNQPQISFTGFGNSTIDLKVSDSTSGTLNFESSGNNLLTINSDFSSDIQFSVSQNETIPIVEVQKDRDVTLKTSDSISVGGGGLILPSIDLVNLSKHEEGMLVFDRTTKVPKYNNGTMWINLAKPQIVTNSLVLLLDAANAKSSNVGISTNWSDISGYRNDGTLINGPTFNPQNGGCFIFDGADDYVQLGSFFNFPQFTISLFVRPGTSQSTYADIFDNNHTGSRNFVLQQDFNSLNTYSFGAINASGGSSTGNFTLESEAWVHLSFTWNNTRVLGYINGNLFATGGNTNAINYESQTLRIGGWQSGGRHWNGRIGNFIVYNRELSGIEIQQNFNADRERFGI